MPKQKIAAFFLILFLSCFLLIFYKNKLFPNNNAKQEKIKITIANTEITADLANTENLRRRGLSGRKSLEKNEGMLFDFKIKDIYPTFWMKGMLFPIDIIWIDNGEIVGIEENIKPEPEKKDNEFSLYRPPKPIDFVLEVKGGFAKENSIKEGDRVEINF